MDRSTWIAQLERAPVQLQALAWQADLTPQASAAAAWAVAGSFGAYLHPLWPWLLEQLP